ncbi:MAG: LacI family transcriptional regulator, partial [Acidimicrobiia bacterium]|nr:LacI family transcriptional regulator [Acidimicrobiia bacterium]
SKVSDKSRAAVLNAIDELGYRPSAAARSLVTGRTNTVAVIMSDPQHGMNPSVMEGIHTSLSTARMDALIMYGHRDERRESEIVESFLELRADAFIFLGSVMPREQLTELGGQIPVVVVGRRMPAEGFDVVAADSFAGAVLAVEHLIGLGHHRIGHIDATLSRAEPQCLAGYRATMAAHDLEGNSVTGSLLQDGGESGARLLLEQDGEFPTAIFAASDLAALGARDVIRAAGFSIPDRVSLVGYGDSSFARLHDIELTSVREPTEAMGIYAAEVAVNRILDPTEPPSEWIAAPELVVRGSTVPPAA